MFFSIILSPLCPSIVTVIAIMAVTVYNDFTLPLYFLPGARVNLLFADVVVITIPPLIMFMFSQRQFVSGMTAGAVKG